MSVPRDAATFGRLLREYRLAAGLTQETLAERSGVSVRSVQHLEAGTSRPRRATARNLAQALRLSDPDREELEIAAEGSPRRRFGDSPPRGDGRENLTVALPHPADADRDHGLVALPRSAPSNVPSPVSSLLGRESDLAAIRHLMMVDRQRLVTLTGVGGSGKTRLAVQVAADLLSEFVDGVWFVDLAPTSDPELVPRIVAGALGVREVPDAPILDTLLGFLRRKGLLLVLDNCEHLIDACAALADRLLTACPDLYMLATSREPLRIAGEQRRQVRPLGVPDLSGVASVDALADTAAVRLFVERAQAIDAEFGLTEANAASVAQICARLDGIPLAIELAAAWMGMLAVDQLAERLNDGFQVLTRGKRGGPTRQQTMEAALGWSYDLLTAPEKATFRTLSTFAGGFDLEAAERVGSELELPTADCPLPTVLDVLSLLVDKSLVVAELTPRGRRYRLLEPVRQYALRLLLTGGEDEGARTRHAAYYAALAERVAPLLRGPEQIVWLERLESERDNLRAALGWIAEHGSVDAGLQLAVAMTPYWEAHGYLSEGRRWLEIVITASRADGPSRTTQMQAVLAAGRLAQWQVDLEGAGRLLNEALATARDLADRLCESEALAWLSAVCRRQGAPEQALMLGEESLRLGRELADEATVAFAQLNQGVTLRHLGEVDRALLVLNESLGHFRRLGDTRCIAITTTMLGWAALEAGEHERAALLLREGVLELAAVGDRGFLVEALAGVARIAEAHGEPGRAVSWLTAADALRAALGMRHPQRNQADNRAFLQALRRQLSVSEFDDAYAAGEAMSLDDLLADIVAAR